MKKLLIGGAVAVILVVGILVYVLLNVDSLVETGVNQFGPRITQTDVHLDNADIGLFSGSGSLDGLRVGNPVNRGFKPRNLLAVNRISVLLDRDSLLSDTVVIHEIIIQSPDIVYETQGKLDNFEALLQNIRETTGSGQESSPSSSQDQTASEKSRPAKKLIIENLYIREGSISADITGLPGKGLTLTLPEIHLTDIGKESGGTTPAQAVAKIVNGLYGGLEQAFKNSGDIAMQGGQWVLDQAGGAAQEVQDQVGGAVDGLKDMF